MEIWDDNRVILDEEKIIMEAFGGRAKMHPCEVLYTQNTFSQLNEEKNFLVNQGCILEEIIV